MIVIEPTAIGEETARWIQVGNCLHKTAVIAGFGCFVSPWVLPRSFKEPTSLFCGGVSFLCAAFYGVSWQFDPCCQYQVEYDTKKLAKLPLGSLTSSSPIVLVRKDDKYRKRLQNLVAGSAFIYCSWKVYKWYFGWVVLDIMVWFFRAWYDIRQDVLVDIWCLFGLLFWEKWYNKMLQEAIWSLSTAITWWMVWLRAQDKLEFI